MTVLRKHRVPADLSVASLAAAASLAVAACTFDTGQAIDPGQEPPGDIPDTPRADTPTGPCDGPHCWLSPLTARDGHFYDDRGGIAILRGYNLAGNSKVPPFVPIADAVELDPLQDWGVNVLRLAISWEAFEPERGQYDEAYLGDMVAIGQAACSRDMYVLVDFHQDGFSRRLAGGCGDGFPDWAIAPDLPLDEPNNGPACAAWGANVAADPRVHASYAAFYADTHGVRSRYLLFMDRLARAFRTNPCVIGYDLINEPWGWEEDEIAPLYRDATEVIRSSHPGAIMFIEGHARTNGGAIQTDLPKPEFDNFAYAPHFYDASVLVGHLWLGQTTATDVGFSTMTSKASEWGAPLFVGEFGAPAGAIGVAGYMDLQYRRLNGHFASSAQWNYTPGWTPDAKDGWNGEDLSVIDDTGGVRANFRVRPYPARIAGSPLGFHVESDRVELTWNHNPEAGETSIFAPVEPLWGATATAEVSVTGDVACAYDSDRRWVRCEGAAAGVTQVSIGLP